MVLPWYSDDSVVALYFASRGANMEVIIELLWLKTQVIRTAYQVRRQLAHIRHGQTESSGPKLYNHKTKVWDLHNVDGWIINRGLPEKELEYLIKVDGAVDNILIGRQDIMVLFGPHMELRRERYIVLP